MSVEAVLSSARGLVVAPAGCGKTQLITEVLKEGASKPYLVLTHTVAGVYALKKRLRALGVPTKNYRISTIDGWALLVAGAFSASCVIRSNANDRKAFYVELRQVIGRFVRAGNIADIVRASYARLLVDEYQDCDADQHALICAISEFIPTVIFGDPMQTVFDFRGQNHPSWGVDVQSHFPQVTSLETPWRWNNAGAPALGEWILATRSSLMRGEGVDLTSCRGHVTWNRLTGNGAVDLKIQNAAQFQLRNRISYEESLLVLGDSARAGARHNFARMANGIDVVEPVDLEDLIGAISNFDNSSGEQLVDCILSTASTLMTGVGKDQVLKRLSSIRAKRNKTPPTAVEISALDVVEKASRESIYELLIKLEKNDECKIYRMAAFYFLKDAIRASISNPTISMEAVATSIREQRRHQGESRFPLRAIGSTLLLKGLESDHALILDAGVMNAKHLYVALSRGAKSIIVLSRNNLVGN